jgi:hypothetical protein
MKKKLILMFAILFAASGVQSIAAQITITIPKIPKIKKDKPVTTQPDAVTTTDGNRSNQDQPVANKPADKCTENLWLQAHMEDIAKRQKDVDSFTPGRGWLVGTATYNHLLFAVSPAAREKWLTDSNALGFKNCPNFVAALDNLAAAAAKKIPLYQPDTKAYAFRSPAEERLMKGKINDPADHKIFYSGIKQASWLIDKNDFGIPTARYKHGLVWVRYVPNDHPYCRIYYINIIQDYAGGGTYGASYARFVGDELAGCPVGK